MRPEGPPIPQPEQELSELEQLKKQLAAAQAALVAEQQKSASLEQELAAEKSKTATLAAEQEKNKTLEQELKALRNELSEIKRQNEELTEKDKELAAALSLEKENHREVATAYEEELENKKALSNELNTEKEKSENLEQELEALKDELTAEKKKRWNLSYDSLSNVERHDFYERKLQERIMEVLKNQDVQKFITSENPTLVELEPLQKIPLTIGFSDIGHLSLYNDKDIFVHYSDEYGANGGIRYMIKNVGNILVSIDRENQEIKSNLGTEVHPFHNSADEFSFFMDSLEEDAIARLKSMQNQYGNIKVEGKPDQIPNIIDFGIAHISEALEAYVKHVPLEERQALNFEENTLAIANNIEKFATNIAHYREKRAKTVEKVFILSNLISDKDDPQLFDIYWKYMSKNLKHTKEDFDMLKNKVDTPEFQKSIIEYIQWELEKIDQEEMEGVNTFASITIEIAKRQTFNNNKT
jgi:hypothetical protein